MSTIKQIAAAALITLGGMQAQAQQTETNTVPRQTTISLSGSTTGSLHNVLGPSYHYSAQSPELSFAQGGVTVEHRTGGLIITGKASSLIGTFRQLNYPDPSLWSNYLYDLNIAIGDTSGVHTLTLGQEGSNSIIGTFTTDPSQNSLGRYPEAANNSPYGLTNIRYTYHPSQGLKIELAASNGFQKTIGEYDNLTVGLNVLKQLTNGRYVTVGGLYNHTQLGIYPAGGHQTDTHKFEVGGYHYRGPDNTLSTAYALGQCHLDDDHTLTGLVEHTKSQTGPLLRGGVTLEAIMTPSLKAQRGIGATKHHNSGRQPMILANLIYQFSHQK